MSMNDTTDVRAAVRLRVATITGAESYTVDDMLGWLASRGHTVEDIYVDAADGYCYSFVLGDVVGGVRSMSFVGLLEAAIIAVVDGVPAAGLASATVPPPVADDAVLWAHAERLADVLLGVKVDHLDEPRVAAAISAHAALLKVIRTAVPDGSTCGHEQES